MKKHIILGILISNRMKEAVAFQELITKHGCNIKTRLGLHNVSGEFCSSQGLVLMEMYGSEQEILDLESKLKKLDGLQVQKMVFEEN
jgi:hypothetical protein